MCMCVCVRARWVREEVSNKIVSIKCAACMNPQRSAARVCVWCMGRENAPPLAGSTFDRGGVQGRACLRVLASDRIVRP